MKKPLKSKSRKPKKTRKQRESRQIKIKKIIKKIECAKNFQCYESKFKDLSRTKDIGLKSFLLCLEENHDCNFSIFFIDEYLCKCPLRVFIAKELKK